MGYWDDKEKAAPQAAPEGKPTLADLEQQCKAELSETEKSFRERMANENKRFRDMCDTEFWCCVCFTSRAQKEEFLELVGMNTEDKYLDGREMARKIGRVLQTPDMRFSAIGKPDKAFLDRTR